MNLDTLEAAAREATQGEWAVDDGHPRDYIGVAFANGDERGHVATIVEFKVPQALRDARHIAACSPATILALIAELRSARDRKACPCQHTTPCHERCSCVMPLSSSGCVMCCSYGSAEQQRAAADQLRSARTVVEAAEAYMAHVDRILPCVPGAEPRSVAALRTAIDHHRGRSTKP